LLNKSLPIENMEEATKEVGRPKGAKRIPAGFRKWQPKVWKVEHEAIVLMHCKGITNREIASLYDMSEVHVGNIINCVKGQEFIEKIRSNLPTKDLEVKYKGILEKAVERLDTFMKSDSIHEKYPIQAVDRAMKSMEMIDARLRANNGGTRNNTVILATEAAVDRLMNAMAKVKESNELHGLTQIGAGVSESINFTPSRNSIPTGSK
jgi:hypothetical protein